MLLQNVVTGLLMGSVYGLVAFGLSLLFGVMKIVNFAHGAVLMIGMYVVVSLTGLVGFDPYLSAAIGTPMLFVIGYLLGLSVEPILMRERSTGPISVLLWTLGFSLFAINIVLIIFGADYRVVESFVSGKTLELAGVIISLPRLGAAIVAVVTFVGLYLLLTRTDVGKAMRATSQDMEAARMLGIDERKMCRMAFAISSATTAVAAGVLVPFYYVSPTVGDVFQLKSFVIVVLGGIGTISGCLLGGLIVGLVESLGAQYLNATYAQMVVFLVFVVILLVRPMGLLGKERE